MCQLDCKWLFVFLCSLVFEIYCVLLCVEELGQKFGPTCMPENHKKGKQNISGQLSRPQRNTYSLRTNFGQSYKLGLTSHAAQLFVPPNKRESWSRFILCVTQEHFYSFPLTLCTFYPLILSIFSTTSSHIITQVQYRSILSALGWSCRRDKAMLSKPKHRKPHLLPTPPFLPFGSFWSAWRCLILMPDAHFSIVVPPFLPISPHLLF